MSFAPRSLGGPAPHFADFQEQLDENTGTPRGTTFLWSWLAAELSGLDQATAATDDREPLGAQDLLRLRLGMSCPGSDRVEPHIGQPMAQGAAAMSLALVGQGEVVMCVGVLRHQRDGALVGRDGVGQPLQF